MFVFGGFWGGGWSFRQQQRGKIGKAHNPEGEHEKKNIKQEDGEDQKNDSVSEVPPSQVREKKKGNKVRREINWGGELSKQCGKILAKSRKQKKKFFFQKNTASGEIRVQTWSMNVR